MKKKLTTLALTAALALFAGTAAKAAGDIYDICPCDANGNDLSAAVASYANPVDAGTDFYFKIRLIARELNGNRWYIKYLGYGDELLQNLLYPMQIGVYVSGRVDYATLVSNYSTGDFSTALVFKYTTKPGDFALPIVLAAKANDDALETFPATADASGGVYAFNPLRSFWDFAFDTTTDNGDGTVTTNTVTCSWRINQAPPARESAFARRNDSTLEGCGFYVKTIDFSDDAEDAAYWRSVHENSTVTGGGLVPRLVASAAPTNAVTLYVWSTDESAVYVDTDNVVSMQVSTTGETEDKHVGTVTFTGGQLTRDFALRGAVGGEGKTARLVLSAYPRYNFSALTTQRLVDYVETPVKCIEPMPPSIIVESDRTTAVANGNYTQPAAVLQVYLSQAYESDLDVTITPLFTDAQGEDWKDYFRFTTSTQGDSIDEPMADGSDAVLPVVRIPANSTERQTVYVYALRSDTHTLGGNKVRFQSSIDDPAAQAVITEANRGSKSLNVSAETTAITTPSEGSKAVSTTCNDEFPFTLAVSDTYADTHDTAKGYAIYVKYRSSDTFVQLDGQYYVGDGGALYRLDLTDPANPVMTTEQPILKYTASGEDLVSQVYVVAPINPNSATAKKSEVRSFLADVKEARTVKVASYDEDFTEERRTFTEGDSVGFKITLSEKNETGDTIYAYLKPSSNADAGMFSAASYNCIVGMENPEGLPINNSMQDVEGIITLLDGYAKPGLKVTFEILLSKNQYWDGVTDPEANKIKGYDSNYLTITVNNVEPTIKRVEMNGIKATGDGYHYNNKLPMGQTQRFTLYVDDPGTYDLTNTNKPFQVRWTTMTTDGSYNDTFEKSGNPRENPLEFSFPAAGEWAITAEVMDKDMDDWSEVTYTVYVTVLDQPALEQPAEEVHLVEKLSQNDADMRKFTVSAGYWDPKYNGKLTILVQVSEAVAGKPNPGTLKLDSSFMLSAANAQTILDALGSAEHPYDPASDYYLVELSKTEMQKSIAYAELDGTDNASIYGFRIVSFVVNDDVLPTSGTPADEYYLAASPTLVYVENLTPEFGTVTLENTNAWKVAGGAATQFPIRWQVRYDVDRDWETPWTNGPGIKITFAGCQNAGEGSQFITEPSSGTFVPNFGDAQGDQTVTLTIEDKDGGVQTWTYLYTVEPSKFLKTYSTGPSGGTTTSKLSQRYYRMRLRGGLGEGHTFVSDATFSSAENFELTWNCAKAANVNAFAFGYKVSDDPATPTLDNGALDGARDIPINGAGRQNAELGYTDYYAYAPADGKDSFFYLWILTTLDENGTPTDTVLGQAISPEQKGPPGMGRVPLPNGQTEDGTYLDTIVEAVYAKEWRVEDNLGDINQDGIPDAFAVTVWGSGQSLIQATAGLDDLDGDLNDISGGNPDNDFLPGVWQSQDKLSLAFKDLASYSPYTANATPFSNRYEIRGFHYGLNETSIADSDPCFSEAETNAYKAAFAAANGRDWEEADGIDLSFWSPEPRGAGEAFRMDPTLEDTDGDGLPDGWEYFFWYQAKVWAPAGEGPGKPRRGQLFVFEKFNPADILRGTEIAAEDVMARFHPCVPLDTEADGYTPDFDGDGLTDLEELIIGTNPCHWDTDGDHMSDGWEVLNSLDPLRGGKDGNPDGDFMAFKNLANNFTVVIDAATRQHVFDIMNEMEYGIDWEYVDIGGLMPVPMTIRDVTLTSALIAKEKMSGEFDADGNELNYVYGRPDDLPDDEIPPTWHWGLPMLTELRPNQTYTIPNNTILLNEPFILIHDQIHWVFGFDPRTGWYDYGNGYVDKRWDPGVNQELSPNDVTGAAVNTDAYCNYDEYLLMRYRHDYADEKTIVVVNGEERLVSTAPAYPDDAPWKDDDPWALFANYTTMPTIAYSLDAVAELLSAATNETGAAYSAAEQTNLVVTANISDLLAQAFAEVGSTRSTRIGHGADTDGDGVPDGWELYMRRNPNAAPSDESMEGFKSSTPPWDKEVMLFGVPDYLGWAEEYAGTDSCNAYKGCESIYRNHPGLKSGWYNKFFPTNPDELDTDGDGIIDGLEGEAWQGTWANGGTVYVVGPDAPGMTFIYGNPQAVYGDLSSTITCCVRGGGMNPCTVDTDLDGLPDAWEMAYAGIPVDALTRAYAGPAGGFDPDIAEATFIADGLGATTPATNVIYICGGMDATWAGDAFTDPLEDGNSTDPLLGTKRDVDFDHDGLQNYQEYFVQTVRHFRYDDITTPLMGSYLDEGEYDLMSGALISPHVANLAPAFTPMRQDAGQFANLAALLWADGTVTTVSSNVTGRTVRTNDVTGEAYTNFVYEVTTNVVAGGGVVANKVYGEGYNYVFSTPWVSAGWRANGYFAPPLHGWDRMIASQTIMPVILMPPSGAAGYVSTDPRVADTDGDGMDDFYEMFHGLNPILGSTAAGSAKDIIAVAWGARPFYNAFWNEWTHHDFSRIWALQGIPGSDTPPLQEPAALDPLLYPWAMGAGEADPDGDGVRNYNERVTANLTSPMTMHTDPTPLWYTDTSSQNSFASLYYALTFPANALPFWPAMIGFEESPYSPNTPNGGNAGPAYMFSFEENEGYDTDNDWRDDGHEIVTTTRPASDPLDFSDPARRQALYLDGNQSWVQSRATFGRDVFEGKTPNATTVDFYKQFTVEAWIRPEKTGAQTIIDRCSIYGYDAINKDAAAIRSNFRIGLTADGRVYGMFDNDDARVSGQNEGVSCQSVYGPAVPLNEWTHVALTFDGKVLLLYVNGIERGRAATGLIPANGVTLVVQDPAYTNMFTSTVHEAVPGAFFIGGRPKTAAEGGASAFSIGTIAYDSMNGDEWFQGYVDEVRVWDGARTASEVAATYTVHMTMADASANREEVYAHLMSVNADSSRNDNDGLLNLTAELVQLYDFSTQPGAVAAADVAKTPIGFDAAVRGQLASAATWAPAEFSENVGWWDACETKSTVYTDYAVVPWVNNTVHHLPVMDGSVVDSFLYSDYLGGYYTLASQHELAKYALKNSAMPYPFYNYFLERYIRLFCLNQLLLARPGDELVEDLMHRYEFTIRSDFIGTDDLLPMGGAYAKTCPAMWDGNGVADAWEYTSVDTDADGLPDWWEEKYGLDAADGHDWSAVVDWNGARLPAYIAYAVDLAMGMQPDGAYHPEYASTVDADGDNIPDWWEKLFGVEQYDAEDDPDKDGLSNYAEYLISFGPYPYGVTNGWAFVSPLNAYSTSAEQKVPDCYLKAPKAFDDNARHINAGEYYGEIFTDHDFMENWWESAHSVSYANPRVYDPDKDTDGDGWDNYSEARAYMWRGSFVGDMIDRWFSADEDHEVCYPEPAIGLRLTYNGVQDLFGKGLVVRTSTGYSPRVDATFVVQGSDGGAAIKSKVIGGYYGDATLHGFLSPGLLIPGSGRFSMAQLSSDRQYVWNYNWYLENGYNSSLRYNTVNPGYGIGTFDEYLEQLARYPHIELEDSTIAWDPFATTVSDAQGHYGTIYYAASNSTVRAELGKIDYRTGEYSLDMGVLASVRGESLNGVIFNVEYESRIAQNWPQTVWVSEAASGHVRRGLNTIEAWIDLDGDGAYTAGEPYGIVRNVSIGWHKTAETVIELKDTSSVIPHYLFADGSSDREVVNGMSGGIAAAEGEDAAGEGGEGSGGLVMKVAVRRVGINGQRVIGAKTVPARTLVSKSLVIDDRAYLTEADVLTDDKLDLDWKWLVSDAAKLGLAVADIRTVEYEIDRVDTLSDGTTTNMVLATFSNAFNKQRPVPVARAPLADAPVYSAAPTFSWTCADDTMMAFRLQVSTSTNAADVIYDSGALTLPGRAPLTVGVNAHSFTAPIYVNDPVATNGAPVVADVTNYYWRVIEFNAKYSAADAKAWSAWTPFQMDVANENRYPKLPTGYGKCGAVVRYFGPGDAPEGQVVVEVHRSADFTGQPLAQLRADISQLADREDVSTVNAAFIGIEPGTVYLMAYIDANNNGRRDANESWGYANYIATDNAAIYTPRGVAVTDEMYLTGEPPKAVVFIEDTDVNRNEIPDCLETGAEAGTADAAGDSDRDGLLDDDEDGFATDASVWDTDGDGMPDGWEVKFADLDPNFDDAAEVADGDVMAFATNACTIVTVQNTAPGSEPANYILKDAEQLPVVGDAIDGYALYEVYDYPVVADDGLVNYYGRGAPVTNLTAAAGTTNRVVAVAPGTVALVHAQVYEAFGFDPTTAVPPVADETGTNYVYGANTKPFTALDKYLVVRYLAALGVCDEDDVNVNGKWAQYTLRPFDADFDRDGVPDGWELYVMFGPNEMNADSFTNGTAISAWAFDDRDSDDDGDDLPAVREYDALEPSDPWNKYSVYESLSGKGRLLVGTPMFTDAEARRFGISDAALDNDDDNDLLTNLEEIQAYYYDRTAFADIDPAKAWSDGETPDYFRAAATTAPDEYLGLLFNGGEFIEPSVRTAMGIDTLSRTGTRDYRKTGWDAWSTARHSILNAEQTVNIEGVVSDELMLLIRYWNVIRPGEFTGTTVGEAIAFFHEVWEGVIRLIDDEGNVLIETKDGDVAGPGTIHDADAAQTTTQILAFFGGQAKVEEVISMNKKDLTADEIVTPEPAVDLTLKYAGNASYDLILEAYQTSSVYPEYGEQLAAQWTTPVKFDAGVAKINQIKTPSLGSLKQGPARFVAYIDADGDGRLSPGETFGMTETAVGYLGCDVTIRLGDGNDAFPVVSLVADAAGDVAEGENADAAEERPIQTVAIVRTKINGEYITPRGVTLRRYDNNVNRTVLYPTDFVDEDFIGVDRYLAQGRVEDIDPSAEELADVEEVTYEIVKLPRPFVYTDEEERSKISNTNLNHYVYSVEVTDESTGVVLSNAYYAIDQQVNDEFTLRYSITRDRPLQVKGEASSVEGGATLSFLVPADRAVTKFWLEIDGEGFGGESNRGYLLSHLVSEEVFNSAPGAAGPYESRRAILDAEWFRENGIALSVGEHTVRVALGNDKFPEMPDLDTPEEWSEPAVFGVARDAVFDAKIAVVVRHPTTDLDAKLTVAAYEKADLAHPAAVTNNCPQGEVVEIGGLRPGASYYVAAWYVSDAEDGRGSAALRMPYDTWGYLCTLDVTNATQVARSMAFDPVSVLASNLPISSVTTNVVWLQDTDWNDNGIADRDEAIKSVLGVVDPEPPAWDEFDVDGDGIPDDEDDDPVFDNSEDELETDVMAYVSRKMLVVQIGTTDAETNWVAYVVHDPESEPKAVTYPDGTAIIPRGTAAGEIKSLYTTYVYGRKRSSPLGMGVPVELDAGIVRSYEWKDVVLVHHQVYDEYGFNPNTANGHLSASNSWVNSKSFTALDKYIVTNYLAAVGALAPDTVWTNWTLNAKRIDFDFDGLPDGWELYTMFGTNGVQALSKTAKENVINAWAFDDRTFDPDGDGLANLDEYDGGSEPTDPWDFDTDGDGINDKDAYDYGLKDGGASEDDDGDGLSNFVEYMLAKVFKLGPFDPKDAFSVNENVSDYFFRINQLYAGEIFTDHDQTADLWESGYLVKSDKVSPYLYDAMTDADNDGWSNYAEFQADTDPTVLGSLSVDAIQMDEYPIPTIELELTYNGNQNIGEKPVVVKAWSDPTLESIPDAVWTLGGQGNVSVLENGNSNIVTGIKYFGMNPKREMLFHLSPGSVVPGSVQFEAKDLAWVLYDLSTGRSYVSDPATAIWWGMIIDRQRADEPSTGDLIVQGDDESLGTIDYATGAMNVDFARFPEANAMVGDISGQVEGGIGGNYISIYNLLKSYLRVTWQSKLITGGNVNTYYLAEADRRDAGNNSLGHVKEGRNTFVAFYDLDGDGQYTAGEPFGCATGVDVGWNYAKLAIELTDTHPVTARICCIEKATEASGASSGSASSGDSGELGLTDREKLYGNESGDLSASRVTGFVPGVPSGGIFERIRVIRSLIDGMPCEDLGIPSRIVLDKMICADSERYITEADFLKDGSLDIDWADLAADLARANGAVRSMAVTNVTYRLVMGNGTVENAATNNLVPVAFNRPFDNDATYRAAKPVALGPGSVTSPSPTFSWAIPLGLNSYTAFRIQIWDASGNNLVWDSEFQPMPPRIDDNSAYKGHYEWTAPITVNDVLVNGRTVFANNTNYKWSVLVANAKYRNQDNWSDDADFRMNLPEPSPNYGAAQVAVRYYGPDAVAAGAVIRVEAYKTPDFSGEPVSRGYVTNKADIASTAAITTANAVIPGLKTGSYYIRAFIDTLPNARRDVWESWGCLCTRDTTVGTIFTPKRVTVGPTTGVSDVIPVYIDDCDTDQDYLPDAWEWATAGNLTADGLAQIDETATGGFALKTSLAKSLADSEKVQGGLAVMVRSMLSAPRVAALLTGADATGTDAQVNRALGSVGGDLEAEPVSVAITGIALDRTASTVTLTADTAGAATGQSAAAIEFYEIPAGADSLELTCTVWHRAALDSGSWKAIATEKVAIEKATRTYTFDLGGDIDLSSGFFKVTLDKE